MTEPGPGTLSADLQVLVDAWTGVAVDLYGQLVAAGGRLDHSNLVVSPSSVSTVLAMILPGARTATADEIAATLHTRLEPERVAAAAGALDRALLELARADELDLRISNAVWTQDGLALRLEFERALVEAFRAGQPAQPRHHRGGHAPSPRQPRLRGGRRLAGGGAALPGRAAGDGRDPPRRGPLRSLPGWSGGRAAP